MKLFAILAVSVSLFLSACQSSMEPKEAVKETTSANEADISPSSETENIVLAKVGGWVLTKSEFNKVLSDLQSSGAAEGMDLSDLNTKEMLLQRMVNTEILYRVGLERGFDKEAKIEGASSKAKRVLVIQKVLDSLASDIEVSEEEIEEFYQNSGLTDKPLSEMKANIIKAIELAKLEEEVSKLADSYRDELEVEVNFENLGSDQ
ncbi:MAG: hypothetical protein GF375_04685 [Candidatus Omnitrophica bacterium]|nr:hypothetical protein [Candidatus Omnitrophota bacterium]MBD3269323.1 hypothetical protein [Candidatus Omnitrophota bacterium]